MHIDEVQLTANQAKALSAWRDLPEDFDVLPFRSVHEMSGLDRHLIRRTVRALARKGLLHFHRGSCTEDGEFTGSGYGLSPRGRAALKAAPPASSDGGRDAG